MRHNMWGRKGGGWPSIYLWAHNKVRKRRRKQYLQPVCHAPNIIMAAAPLDIRLAMAAAGGRQECGAPIRRGTTRDEMSTDNTLQSK